MSATRTDICPRCGTALPVEPGYVTWCPACNWNVTSGGAAESRRGPLDRLYSRAGRRLGDRLAAELLRVEELEPRLTPAKLVAYAVAAAVHSFVALLFVSGLVLALLGWPNPFAVVAGVLAVIVAVFMRPRVGRVPDRDLISRAEAPALHSLVDEVAAALRTRAPDLIVVDEGYNASWWIGGLRRTRVLTLGLPLFTVLAPQERVSLIAHELAHARNGDSSRGLVIGAAVSGLATLYWLLTPDDTDDLRADVGIAQLLGNAVMWLLTRPLVAVLWLEAQLLARDSQRAEYLADDLEARVAGTSATLAAFEKLLLQATVEAALQRAAARRTSGELLDEIERAVATAPEHERERRRRAARLETSRLGASHPPTGSRIALLEGRPRREPQVVLDGIRSARIDAELQPRRNVIAARMVDLYQDSLYY